MFIEEGFYRHLPYAIVRVRTIAFKSTFREPSKGKLLSASTEKKSVTFTILPPPRQHRTDKWELLNVNEIPRNRSTPFSIELYHSPQNGLMSVCGCVLIVLSTTSILFGYSLAGAEKQLSFVASTILRLDNQKWFYEMTNKSRQNCRLLVLSSECVVAQRTHMSCLLCP